MQEEGTGRKLHWDKIRRGGGSVEIIIAVVWVDLQPDRQHTHLIVAKSVPSRNAWTDAARRVLCQPSKHTQPQEGLPLCLALASISRRRLVRCRLPGSDTPKSHHTKPPFRGAQASSSRTMGRRQAMRRWTAASTWGLVLLPLLQQASAFVPTPPAAYRAAAAAAAAGPRAIRMMATPTLTLEQQQKLPDLSQVRRSTWIESMRFSCSVGGSVSRPSLLPCLLLPDR